LKNRREEKRKGLTVLGQLRRFCVKKDLVFLKAIFFFRPFLKTDEKKKGKG